MTHGARYLIFPDASDSRPQFSTALGTLEADYLEAVVDPVLQPLEETQYIEGAQGILTTWAKYSYVVFKAWNAQSDSYWRRGWQAATADEMTRWECAMARAHAISRQTDHLSGEERDSLLRRCQASGIWRGTIVHG